MPKPDLILALARVMIAVAWADGRISNQELNCLKDLLFRLPQMSARRWAELEIYMETPVLPAERQRLLEELRARLSRREDKELVIQALDSLVHADGDPSPEAQAAVDEIRMAIESQDLSPLGKLGRLLDAVIERRAAHLQGAPNREQALEDFLRNRVYFHLQQRLQREGKSLPLDEASLRKLSLAGGLMARVAQVDRQVTEAERRRMAQILSERWQLDPEAAAMVVEVALDAAARELDEFRLTRSFFGQTTAPERLRFVEALFHVAAADGQASRQEMEAIRRIAQGLKLTHRQFIQAKLSLPRAARAE